MIKISKDSNMVSIDMKDNKISIDNIKVGDVVYGYEVVDFQKDEHPIFGDLYTLQNKDELIYLYELELMNNLELWERRANGNI